MSNTAKITKSLRYRLPSQPNLCTALPALTAHTIPHTITKRAQAPHRTAWLNSPLFLPVSRSQRVGLQSHSLDLAQIQIPLSGWLTRSCTDPGASCWLGWVYDGARKEQQTRKVHDDRPLLRAHFAAGTALAQDVTEGFRLPCCGYIGGRFSRRGLSALTAPCSNASRRIRVGPAGADAHGNKAAALGRKEGATSACRRRHRAREGYRPEVALLKSHRVCATSTG